jgi:hypothetical protein
LADVRGVRLNQAREDGRQQFNEQRRLGVRQRFELQHLPHHLNTRDDREKQRRPLRGVLPRHRGGCGGMMGLGDPLMGDPSGGGVVVERSRIRKPSSVASPLLAHSRRTAQ